MSQSNQPTQPQQALHDCPPANTAADRSPQAFEPGVSSGLRLARLGGALLLGMIAGPALQLQQAVLFSATVYAVLMAAAAVLMVCLAGLVSSPSRYKGAVWSFLAAALLAAAFGFGLTGLRAANFQSTALNPALEGQDIVVTGKVQAMPQLGADGVRFRLAVESAQLAGQTVVLPPLIYLGWYTGFGGAPAERVKRPTELESDQAPRALLELQRQPQDVRVGERWQMTVRLKAPHGDSNPHGFDYELWLWEQGLQATGYVRAGPRDQPARRLAITQSYPIERARQAVRESIFERVDDRQTAGILAALVVGDQKAIDQGDWDVFRATGVAHLMSISGLHITMFAWMASQILAWLWRRSAQFSPALCFYLPAGSAGALGGLFLAALYAVFAGWGLPAQRTVWMLATVVLVQQSGKQWPWPWVWLLAMAAVVTVDPWALLQPGFWLSFVAVGVLFAAGQPQGEQIPSGDSALHTVSERRGSIFTAGQPQGEQIPLGDSALHTVSERRGSIFTAGQPQGEVDQTEKASENAINLIAINDRISCRRGLFDAQKQTLTQLRRRLPLSLRQLLARLGQSLLELLKQQWLITLALTPLSLLLFNQVSLVGLLANVVAIPWVTLLVTPLAILGMLWPPIWDVVAQLIGMLTWLLRLLAAWPLAFVSTASAPLLYAVAGVAGGVLLAMRLPRHARLLGVPLLLPVLLWQPARPAIGQFDVLGADVGQGNAVLIRTASHSLVYDTGPRFSSSSDAGQRVLVPLLRAMAERVDTLVLSHRDADHIGGAPAVLAMYPSAQLISSIEDAHPLQNLRRATRCTAGQHWHWDGVDFSVLHPSAEDYSTGYKSNTMSCVLRVSNGAQTALLPGDLEAAQERRLVNDPILAEKIKADFLLMPHHGSKTSSSTVFLDQVKPRIALSQAGYRNRYGHPAESVLVRYKERDIRVVDSPTCGAALWRSAQPSSVACQRQIDWRYWHYQPKP